MRFLGGLVSLGIYGLFAGILFIAAVFWFHSRDLPNTEQLAEYQPPTLSRVHAGDGRLMAEFHRERRLYTPIDEIPDLVRHAFISAEDRFFYEHDGVDGVAVMKAMVDNVFRVQRGERLRGASTITQQVVKNFLLSGERAVSRKVREAILAWRLEEVLTKDQILELYLNEIFLGVNAYGVTAAAETYFGKRLVDLEPAEAAYLAALPKAPSTLHPVRRKDAATARRNYVLREMFENGYIDKPTFDSERDTPLDTVLDDVIAPQGEKLPPIDYFAEEIRRQLVDRMGEGKVYGGGLSVRSTVDPEMQVLARRSLQRALWSYSQTRGGYVGPVARIADLNPEDETVWRAQLDDVDAPRDVAPWRLAVVLLVGERSAQIGIEGFEADQPIYLPFSDVREWAKPREGLRPDGTIDFGPDPATPSDVWSVGDVIYVERVAGDDGARWSMRQIPQVNGALVAMDPHTGRVLAMQGGFSYNASVFNRATQAKRQPGSAVKPFVYAAALENGYEPNSIVLDAPVSLPQLDDEVWKPQNYSGKFYGPSPLRWGLEKSQNLMTVRVAMDVGLETVADYAERLGVYEEMPPLFSYALGAGETTLMKLVASYAMFVNGGKLIEPTLIDRIQNRHGETIFRHDSRICSGCRSEDWRGQREPYVPDEGEQVLDPGIAYQVVSMLEGVAVRGTAASTVGAKLDFPVAGKTGTTNDARDAWFIGFAPDLAVGCFVGFDAPRSLGPRMSGGTLCGPVFADFMGAAMRDRPKFDFRRPVGVTMVKIDRHTGCAVDPALSGPDYILEAFRADAAPATGQCGPGSSAFLVERQTPTDAGVTPGQPLGPIGGALDGGLQGGAVPGVAPGGIPGVTPALGGAPRPPRPTRPDSIGEGSGGLY